MGTFSVLFPIQKTPLLGFAVLVAILIRLGKSVTGQDKSNDKTDECKTKYVHFDLEVAKLTLDLCCVRHRHCQNKCKQRYNFWSFQ